MFYTIENYNANTCATIHGYSVEFEPFPHYTENKVFSNKKDAVAYAKNAEQQDEKELCKIVVCSFSYIIFTENGAEEFPSKIQAMRRARQIKKENSAVPVSVGFYDVTVDGDIICLDEWNV